MPKKSPPILVKKVRTREGTRLVPESAYDEELLDAVPVDTLFSLRQEARRSGRLHRTYWKALGEIVKATGNWPTAHHLHDDLMWDLGYITTRIGLDGRPRLVRDSIAYDQMPTDTEFRPYFDAAMARLAEATGIDPLEFLSET